MGQYQEWLLAQEIDRRLKAEAETLEREILYLKNRITVLEQTTPDAENMILQALMAYLRPPAPDQANSESDESQSTDQKAANWSGLPWLETPPVPAAESTADLPGKYARQKRLPEDMLAFFDERRQVNPTLALYSSTPLPPENEEHPMDAETRHLNENIQRWFERWHREASSVTLPEVQNGQ